MEELIRRVEARVEELSRRYQERVVIPLFDASEAPVGLVEALKAGAGVTLTRSGRFGIITAAGGAQSLARHVFVPDAAPGVVITAGDAQGVILHSGPSGETATKLYVDAETAPGASGLPITVQYGDTDDLDTVASWTTIATVTLSSEKSTNTPGMSNASIPATRLMRMNVGTIAGSPADATVTLLTKAPLL